MNNIIKLYLCAGITGNFQSITQSFNEFLIKAFEILYHNSKSVSTQTITTYGFRPHMNVLARQYQWLIQRISEAIDSIRMKRIHILK